MPITDPNARDRYDFYKRQKPTMTEAEWRAAGWKAAPTRYQLQHPMDGLCYECKYQRGTTRFGRKQVAVIVTLVATTLVLVLYVALRTLL